MDYENPQKKFKVHISDEDFFSTEEIPAEQTSSNVRKKFVVNIDENSNSAPAQDEAPKYNGEIYFSGRKPVKPAGEKPKPAPVKSEKKPAPKKKKKISRSFGTMCVCFVLAFTVILSAIALTCINDILAISRNDDLVTVNIPADATTNDIIDILSDNGLVKQKLFCKLFYKAFETVKSINKKNVKAPVYLSGVYYVEKNMGLEGFLTEFKQSQAANQTVTLTFQEGWSVYQMFDRLEKFGVCSKERLLASLNSAQFENSFIKEISNDPLRTSKLEGYFFPETYEFFEDSDPNSVIRKFLAEYEERWTDEYEARSKELGMTRDQIMILASIIQREAANNEQMGLVSSVLYNRLRHPVSWPTLGCDSTQDYITNYVTPNVNAAEALTYSQAYNTYNIQGLPPGPVCNPGDAAIKAALYPDDTDYYYFRHDKFGKIYMAKTQAEHDANGNLVLRANSSK